MKHLGAGRIEDRQPKLYVFKWRARNARWRVYCTCCDQYWAWFHWGDAYAMAYYHASSKHTDGRYA